MFLALVFSSAGVFGFVHTKLCLSAKRPAMYVRDFVFDKLILFGHGTMFLVVAKLRKLS